MEQSEVGEYDVWGDLIVLVTKDGLVHVFEIVKSPGIAGCGALAMPEGSPEHDLLVDVWPRMVLCHTMWKHFGTMHDRESRRTVLVMLDMFITKNKHIIDDLDLLAESFQKPFMAVTKAVKGLTGLVRRTPGSATLEDVRYVLSPGQGYTTGLAADLPKLGRALITTLRKDVGKYWLPGLDQFEQCIGYMLMVKDTYTEMMAALENCRAELSNVMQTDAAAFASKTNANIVYTSIPGLNLIRGRS